MESDGFDQYEEDQEAYYVEFLKSKGYEITPPKPKWSDYIELRTPFQHEYVEHFGEHYAPTDYWFSDTFATGRKTVLEIGEMSFAKNRLMINVHDTEWGDISPVFLNKNQVIELQKAIDLFLHDAHA